MTFYARRIILALLMFCALAMTTAAQDGVKVSGSAVAGEAFRAAVADESFEYDLSGTTNGVSAFCAGTTDIVLTNRPLSLSEASTCAANGVEFSELMIGFDGYALIASPDIDEDACLTVANLDAAIAPSLVGTEVKWTSIDASYPDAPISFVYSGINSRPAALLDRSVRGEGFRSDALVLADSTAVIADVAAGRGKLGLVGLSDALTAGGVSILNLNNPTIGTCVAPSAEDALNRLYAGGDRLFAYAAASALAKPGVAEALSALAGGAESIAAAGFVPLSGGLLEQAAAVAAGGTLGRVFSNDVNTYQILGETAGTLRVGGSGVGASYLKAALADITPLYGDVTLEESYLGAVEAVREFCAGNREIVAVSAPLTADEQAACEASEVAVFTVELGAKAAVLVGNVSDDYLACVPTALVADVFASGTDVDVWNAYDAAFPELPVYLFVAGKGDSNVDLMMVAAAGRSVPVRDDVQVNADPAYRANAVANTPGAVAVMTWDEAQDVLENQQGIRLVSVQADGGECVAPSAAAIVDGTYPLAQPVTLLVNRRSLETDMVQAILYSMFGDDNYILIEEAGLVGLSFGDLVGIRTRLVEAFRAADAAQAERFAQEGAATQTAAAAASTPSGEATEAAPDATATPEG